MRGSGHRFHQTSPGSTSVRPDARIAPRAPAFRTRPPPPRPPLPFTLYAHPFSSYCQKVLVAPWENGTPFAYRHMEEPGAREDLARLWPIAKFPVLVDGDRTVVETSIIVRQL
jgi:hypothetical protein